MPLHAGQHVLRGLFTLSRRLDVGPAYETWQVDPDDGEGILIKAWPFLRDEPSPVERNLWDRELRTLYRLASTPEAERRLVTLIDAAVDREARAFALALKVPGFDRLADIFENKKRYGWLSDLKDVEKRAALWRGALRLVEGLAHVHRFRSVHRAVSARNVFLDANLGPESFRLGGFEWSVRLGELVRAESVGASPVARTNASLNADWQDLGIVLAGLFGADAAAIESGDINKIIRAIQGAQRLSQDEKLYIRSLVSADGYGAIDRDDIIRGCENLIENLEGHASLRANDRLGVVVSLRTRVGPTDLAVAIAETVPDISANDEEALRRWIEEDLSSAEVIASGDVDNPSYFLKGRLLPYRLFPFDRQLPSGDSEPSWNLGYLFKTEYIDERRVTRRSFPVPHMLRAYSVQTARANYSEIAKNVRPWSSVLPSPPQPASEPQAQMVFLRRFLQVTNEIERAIRQTEIFPVRLVEYSSDDVHEHATFEEMARDAELPMFDKRTTPSMADYLTDEDAKGQSGPLEIYVGSKSDLRTQRRIKPEEFWTFQGSSNNTDDGTLRQINVRRFVRRDDVALPPPATGYLRTFGMFAQVALLDRREDAIDLLSSHMFLQRALVLPDTVYMDLEVEDLPLAIPSEAKFDGAKRDVLKQIWRTRPIYCLQGPPGTGKTTLVAQLLRQIYENDPSCQVLLTAQAHSAVDHLRDEVSKFVAERHAENPLWTEPLAVRLRRRKPGDSDDFEDSVSPSAIGRKLLREIVTALEGRKDRPAYLDDWLSYAREQRSDGDFDQLVRRSANFVYCTSTAGDLLELAQSNQTFDWSIIEEAGKAHGFDLVLPLQTGHRWILIGDQNQLPPYRQKDFASGLDRVAQICQADADLRRFWDDLTPTARQDFTDEATRWLFFFRELFATAQRRSGTGTPLVGMLTEQHRMHPDIGDMISHAFYGNRITNGTVDDAGIALARVLHDFEGPAAVQGTSIVWVDVGGTSPEPSTSDFDGEGWRVNHREVGAVDHILWTLRAKAGSRSTTALLTPYRRQLRALRSKLADLPPWASLPEGYERVPDERVGVFTVDSFQGRQASVVVVSLVRNNTERDTGRALGFLREYERINVMMSRAEKLLILVGSWEFFRAHLATESRAEGQPFAQLARLIDWLEVAFANGRARLVSIDQFAGDAP